MAYTLVRAEQFEADLARIVREYPACEAAFSVAMQTIEQNADQCGISTNRGLRYIGTRELIEAPGFWIFFNFDEAKGTATFTLISEKPRTLAAEEDTAE
jgi:hypothetical protein